MMCDKTMSVSAEVDLNVRMYTEEEHIILLISIQIILYLDSMY